MARMFRNECYMSFDNSSLIVRQLQALAECWSPAHWFLSVISCLSSPRNMAAFMRLIKTAEWCNDLCIRDYDAKALM